MLSHPGKLLLVWLLLLLAGPKRPESCRDKELSEEIWSKCSTQEKETYFTK